MHISKTRVLSLFAIFGLAIFTTSMIASPVKASTFFYEGFAVGGFKPASSNAPLWSITWGADYQGFDTESDASSITLHRSGWFDKFARLSVLPGGLENTFYLAEMADMQTGYVSGQPGRYEPSRFDPVVLKAKVRWSDNYNSDGTGTASGSSGIWFWNSPMDLVNGTINPVTAIGFNWTSDESAYSSGLNFGVFQDQWPVVMERFDVDMHQWNDFELRWERTAADTDRVILKVNGQEVQRADLGFKLPSLSLEMWNDNQVGQADGSVGVVTILERQDFDIDYVTIY